jgi:succinate dehydrogenase / fumarate reductase flavoprotein subunit
VAAQGGIGASLGNMAEDNWLWHMYDTIKGSDWLGDQDAIEYMCRMAPKVVYELEHFGMPFDRNADGTIYQRPFGGHSANFGEKPVQRACAAADRTGHAMLHTLYQRNVRAHTQFFVEWMALDLVRNADGDCVGVVAYEMETAKSGSCRPRSRCSPPVGPGASSPLHQCLHQYRRRPRHGRARGHSARGHGVLAVPSHGCGRRGRAHHRRRARAREASCSTRTASGSWSATRPTSRTWPRATWYRARWTRRSRKAAASASTRIHVLLKLDHLGPEVIMKRLPSIREIALKFANVDPIKEPIPVVPTIHYQMGGIPDQRARSGGGTEERRAQHDRPGPLRGRRVRVRFRARRQSPRHQFAARPPRLRTLGG